MVQKLALIAHDHKKVDLVAWATFNRDTLAAFPLVATGHTARLVRDKVGLEVEELLSGPEGGDAQIAAGVAMGEIDAVFFFVDPSLRPAARSRHPRAAPRLQRPQRPGRHQPRHRRPHHRRASLLRRRPRPARVTAR